MASERGSKSLPPSFPPLPPPPPLPPSIHPKQRVTEHCGPTVFRHLAFVASDRPKAAPTASGYDRGARWSHSLVESGVRLLGTWSTYAARSGEDSAICIVVVSPASRRRRQRKDGMPNGERRRSYYLPMHILRCTLTICLTSTLELTTSSITTTHYSYNFLLHGQFRPRQNNGDQKLGTRWEH